MVRFQRKIKKTGLFHWLFSVLLVLVSFFIWSTVGTLGYIKGQTLFQTIGIVPTPILISGTGSMYPTFPKGTGKTLQELSEEVVAEPKMNSFPGGLVLFDTHFFKQNLARNDIVSFQNEKTNEIIMTESPSSKSKGFVKRVIGLPGDVLQIRDGYVIRNGEQLKEPYTAEPRSTFGGVFLPDCTTITVPENHIFVLGDNRKASNDSRHDLGFVSIDDITHVLHFEDQSQYNALWRDTTHDNELASTPLLDSSEYIEKLNQLRVQNGKSRLLLDEKLSQSARIRAEAMLKFNDLSFEATRSGVTMTTAMKRVGYSNTLWGEAPTLGYYSADELVSNFSQFPKWKEFLLDGRYQETGIATVVGEMNGCPVQIVVQHVAGYVPPNYSQEDLDSWRSLLSRLKESLESWKSAREFGALYEASKSEYERIIAIIEERIQITQQILHKIESNQWLSDNDQTLMNKSKELGKEQEDIATMLNARVQSEGE